jgi:hypothetical protein
VRAGALGDQEPLSPYMEDRPVLVQTFDRVRRLPSRDRGVRAAAHRGDCGADLFGIRERSHAIVRDHDVDVRMKVRQCRSERLRACSAPRYDRVQASSFPLMTDGEYDHYVATLRSYEIDGHVDETLTAQRNGVFRAAETDTMTRREDDRRDNGV